MMKAKEAEGCGGGEREGLVAGREGGDGLYSAPRYLNSEKQ